MSRIRWSASTKRDLISWFPVAVRAPKSGVPPVVRTPVFQPQMCRAGVRGGARRKRYVAA